ncbi:unnamed protein product [Rhizoctonia solani]|uniref:F-box domain-containing protein n=1 Tax=Rhizoctonia solani TaxID=456999 RepID=A0A8H3HRN6_9AGAM|nr:unnamed protein product [Rhizoctonia solani]
MPSVAPRGSEGSETVALELIQLERTQQRIHNDMQIINKLPTELLSRIFTIGEVSDRSTRPRTSWYIGFQETVTNVCHRWREVATRCPTLWTYIHITRPSPYHLISLYLDRAGSGSLLDIDIEMRTRFWRVVAIEAHDWGTQLHKVPYLLKFLISRGATVDRWRSLTVCAKQPELLYAIIGFINAKPARALQFISCTWKYWRQDSEVEVDDEELRSLEYPHLFSESFSFSPSMMPKLRTVEFNAIPWDYVFGRSPDPPILTGLTSLSLTSAHFPCLVHDLQKLISYNPELEHLSLSISKEAATEFYNMHEVDTVPSPEPPRVRLPKLLSLSFDNGGNAAWAMSVFPMIEAPVLRLFSITGDFTLLRESLNLAEHLTGGEVSFLQDLPTSSLNTEDNRPSYPLLDELDISRLSMVTDVLLRMLFSLPTITKVHVSNQQIKQLKSAPQVLPNLEHIYCSLVSYKQLGDLLWGRLNVGAPVGTVHLDHAGLDEVGGLLPEHFGYREYHYKSTHELDYDESDLASNDGLGEDQDTLEDSSDDLMLVMMDDSEVPGSSDEEGSSPSGQELN